MCIRDSLGIKHQKFKYGYLCGIECDGAAYHSSVSARDNDITRQRVLEGMGWNIYRIWSTNWFDNPKVEIKKLDNYVKNLLNFNKKHNLIVFFGCGVTGHFTSFMLQ